MNREKLTWLGVLSITIVSLLVFCWLLNLWQYVGLFLSIRSWAALLLLIPDFLIAWVILGCQKPKLTYPTIDGRRQTLSEIFHRSLMVPVTEELVFRGLINFVIFGFLIYLRLPAYQSMIVTILVCSLIFSLTHIHQGLRGVLSAFVGGVFLEVILILGGLPLAIIEHVIYDFVNDCCWSETG